MNLPLLDLERAYARAGDDYAAQRDTSQLLAATRVAVELEIRETLADGFRDPASLVPFALIVDDADLAHVRVECTFDRAFRDALEDPAVRTKVLAAMREPHAERAKRLLRAAEAAVVEYHVAAHAPALAKLRAGVMR